MGWIFDLIHHQDVFVVSMVRDARIGIFFMRFGELWLGINGGLDF